MTQKLSINIPVSKPPQQLSIELPGDVSDDLALYFKAAEEQYAGLTLDDLVAAILRDHFQRDRAFQAILRGNTGGSKRGRKKKEINLTDDAAPRN